MILIIANARRRGGLSGSDNIYEAFQKHWPGGTPTTLDMINLDYKPFWLCYAHRIIRGCWWALTDKNKYEFVYSASDFLMDSLPALIYKIRGCRWVAGYYLSAPKDNFIYYWTQKVVHKLITKYADVVCVTNESMFDLFPGKPRLAVHGGVDLTKAKQSDKRPYDAVFVGRLHYTKGIEELTLIWNEVIKRKPDAYLAVIGDGDTERELMKNWTADHMSNVAWFSYLGDERFDVYAKSKMVLYTTPPEHSHFSMGPVEAMACGCPMVTFEQPVMEYIKPHGVLYNKEITTFSTTVLELISDNRLRAYLSKGATEWANTWDWSKRAPKILKEIRGYLR